MKRDGNEKGVFLTKEISNNEGACKLRLMSECDSDLLVSVIVPVYNVAPYLDEAINSVIQQTYSNLEIILVDDGSTDGSGKICNSYMDIDERITVIHQQNKGLSAARNVGLDCVAGDAVVFLDPDDAYHPDFIKSMVEAFILFKPDIVVCKYTNHNTMGIIHQMKVGKTYPSISQGVYDRNSALQALIDEKLNVNVWNKLYKSELWKQIRFSEGHVSEDNEATYRITSICDYICVIDSPMYFHRKHPASITMTISLENIHDQQLARARVESYIRSNIPNIFSLDQLRMFRQKRLNIMIVGYNKLQMNGEIGKDEYGEELRNQIIELGNEIVAECRFRTKIAYRMICYCPWLLRIVCPVYLSIRQLIYTIFGK